MHVINYLQYDTLAQSPTIAASFDPPGTHLEEGTTLLIEAAVTDDVQVRDVSLELDGTISQVDGSFPFQFFQPLPPYDPASDNRLELRLIATDTGGNSSATPLTQIGVLPDTTPPTVLFTTPNLASGVPPDYFGSFALGVFASEALDPLSIDHDSVLWSWAGADLAFGTGDDARVQVALSVGGGGSRLTVSPLDGLSAGPHRLVLRGALIADLAGNQLDGEPDGAPGGDFVLTFDVVDEITVFWDGGGDGVAWEDPSTGAVTSCQARPITS